MSENRFEDVSDDQVAAAKAAQEASAAEARERSGRPSVTDDKPASKRAAKKA